ncbi:hypothetical protein HPB52_020260 [Rhipicephalus sanguineus]|uniref:Uncharacterized protein n=1 Tax=Rhipicephalus sanguineus TaxID=34632 RepID=A0A9D4PPR7_RHISA|nr:hypothetical protein HPB52_020260 [Rhipicephalus sanguineus]
MAGAYIWDDMLRQISAEKLKPLGKLVEPMVWTYVKDVYRFISYSNWATYSEAFEAIWAASAFKGAFGETLTVPNVRMHLENNEGIVVTGWQRYDHFATLCELFPAGLPSLILNLLVLSNGAYSTELLSRFHSLLKCSHSRLIAKPSRRQTTTCHDVTVGKAWITEYNVRRNLTLPTARDVLREVFDEYTVAEWIEQNIYPWVLRLEKLWNDALSIKKTRTWPVRPLEPLPDLRRFNVGESDET